MKFGKEFAAQMVPEWQQAYMDYNFLKTHLKTIHHYRQRSSHSEAQSGLKRKLTLYRAFSGLTQRETHRSSSFASETDIENQAILVSKNGVESYRTTFLKAAEEGGENELVYFRMLDDEFNKVNDFYKSKVDEVREEAEMLNKQMDALIAFRVKVENPEGLFRESEREIEMGLLSSEFAASSAGSSSPTPTSIRSNGKVQRAAMDAIGEGRSPNENRESDQEQSNHGNDETKAEISENSKSEREKPKKTTMAVTLPPLKVLDNVKINNTLETPRSTIKGFLNYPWNSELKFNTENLVKVEEKLRQAFVVFYQKLLMLKSFSFLNMLAFSKIMKKYDKITSRNAAKSYMKMVDVSYLGSSDEVTKLMERAEKTFIKHFCNSSRRKGMNILRPKAKKERHRTTFSMGFFGGCMVALIAALVLIIHARNILDAEGGTKYMETLFPLYSLFGFVVLHMLMYAGNIYFWRRYRVNYSFIFGFKQGTELSYREVLLLSFGLAVLALGCVLSNLDMEMDAKTKDYKAFTELLPLALVLLVMVTLLLPFNIIYRSSRFFFIATLFHCLAAPLYKVTLPDFFLADQLTSQVQALRSLEFYICYYGWGDYKNRENTCRSSDVFNTFYFLVAVIPYWSRLLQCLRRLFEEKDPRQGFNGLKYFFAIAAVSLRTAYRLYMGLYWKRLAWIFSIVAAIFGTYWDLVMDWGLLQLKSKNFLLRDKLLVPYKTVYFAAMVLNVLLRLAWMQTVLDFQVSFLHRQGLVTVVACLEIIRRGIWNFFRLENEHLNNVGKYRAFKSIPLPFNYEDDDDEKED